MGGARQRSMQSVMLAGALALTGAKAVAPDEAVKDTPTKTADGAEERRHAIEVSPISPFIRIYAVQYAYQLTPHHELVTGPTYMNIQYDDGETNALGVILGYRFYPWRGLHVEYQLWPIYDRYWESNEAKYYKSFDLWNEARVGYRIDFELWEQPFFVTPQFAFGFGLYAGNKPESFKEQQRQERFFYAPLFFLGVKL